MNIRALTAKILLNVLHQKKSLTQLQNDFPPPGKDRALVQELCFGFCRFYYQLDFIGKKLLQKPLKSKDEDIYILILLGIYQLLFTRVPPHAALSETVTAARFFKKEWATKLINAVLRSFLKQKSNILERMTKDDSALYAHPAWLLTTLKHTWPKDWKNIVQTNNEYPPLCLRINQQKISRERYLQLLKEHDYLAESIPYTHHGVLLEDKKNVTLLPGFELGYISVQDGAAQLAAQLLNPQEGERILDACAAPGGKTCHLLELQPKLKELVAVDNDSARLDKLRANLKRLDLSATIVDSDIQDVSWWDGAFFDRILLDAPCSATGVIQRHPDIKLLRTPDDIERLQRIQIDILEKVWTLLKVGGTLVYVTCSILDEENSQIIKQFLHNHVDCQEDPIFSTWGISMDIGKQILPGSAKGMDGFYYAILKKISSI